VKLFMTSGVGAGHTGLSAFDAALLQSGIANYNLLPLSSVIPPGSEMIERTNANTFGAHGQWGDKLYVVLAEMRVETKGDTAWAGIGWVQDESGKGLLVEHHDDTEAGLQEKITLSLQDLMKNRNYPEELTINMKTVGVECKGSPVCALVAVVFQSEPWR